LIVVALTLGGSLEPGLELVAEPPSEKRFANAVSLTFLSVGRSAEVVMRWGLGERFRPFLRYGLYLCA